MKKLFFILLLSALSSTAFAQADTRHCALGSGARSNIVLSGVSLNAGLSARTFTFGQEACGDAVASFRYLVVEIEFLHTTDGNVILTCATGQSTEVADKTPQVCSGSGTCIMQDAGILSKAVSGNKKWTGRIGIRGYVAWSCVISHDSTPVAGDIATVGAHLID